MKDDKKIMFLKIKIKLKFITEFHKLSTQVKVIEVIELICE